MKVRLLKAMCFGGARHEAGTSVEVSDLIGRELLTQGRAERVDGAKTPSGPMTTETAAAVVSGKKAAKESANVSQ